MPAKGSLVFSIRFRPPLSLSSARGERGSDAVRAATGRRTARTLLPLCSPSAMESPLVPLLSLALPLLSPFLLLPILKTLAAASRPKLRSRTTTTMEDSCSTPDRYSDADMLSKLGSGRKPIPPGIFLEHLKIPSVKGADAKNPDLAVSPAKEIMVVVPEWTKPLLDYLIDQKLPDDEVHARQIVRRSKSYTVIDGKLYKRSVSGVFQKCVSRQDGIEILREIHQGDCGHHAAPRSLVAKAFRAGFYWLTAKEDADKIVTNCRGCQFYATQPNAPAQELRTIPITWPFAVWGLDMVGKLKKSSPGGFEYLLVAVDKFSKWIEAKPVRKADGATALKFVASLVSRYGVPHSIITDNGTNFAHGDLKEYCHELGIRLDLASVAHPQSNGQVERANGLIMAGVKPRLEAPLRRAAGAWADELDSVLWSLRTTPNRSTGYTPFFLVYGAEAVLPSDIIHDSPRVANYKDKNADEARQLSVDLLEEERNLADQRSAIYQQKLRRYHSRRVRSRSFKEGDLVLRLRQVKEHKLQSPWEGPFVISKALHNGSYYLIDIRDIKDRNRNFWRKRKREDSDDIYDETSRPWNIEQLRPFHT